MTQTTFDRLVKRLTNDIMHHPHKDELLKLLQDQLNDDTFTLVESQLCN